MKGSDEFAIDDLRFTIGPHPQPPLPLRRARGFIMVVGGSAKLNRKIVNRELRRVYAGE